MPLPAARSAWPPPEHCRAYDRYQLLDAWYAGDPEKLAAIYGGISGLTGDRVARNRPTQYRGGIVGKLSRMFWGSPTPLGEQRKKLHVPAAADIPRVSASQLFSEPPTFRFEKADQKAADRLAVISDRGKLQSSLLNQAEVGAAFGDAYLRIVWDKDLRDFAWLDVVHADAALPEWRYGILTAVTFWTCLQDDGREYIRHLERHEPGFIEHAVFKGTSDNLGEPVSLDAYPQTKGLLARTPTGTKRLTAVHVPNMTPNRDDRGSALGRADIAGVDLNLDALDETYTSWMRDVRLGKARIFLPSQYLEAQGPGEGAAFADSEVYIPIRAMQNADKPAGTDITAQQFTIRWQEHRETMLEHLTIIVRAAGWSLQTLGDKGDVAVTATEVDSRDGMTDSTRGMKELHQRAALAEIIPTLLEVDAVLFGTGVTPAVPDVMLGDTVQENPKVLAETADLLRRAEAASTETLVRLVHPDWDDDQIKAEVTAIQGERETIDLGNPEQGFGGPGNEPPPPADDPEAPPNG